MAKRSKPKRGSMAFSPRKRARSMKARMRSWPKGDEGPRVAGFAGYKAGMTHTMVVDPRPKSTTSGQEIQMPVTVIEVPPLKVIAVRFYERSPYGLISLTDIWNMKVEKELERTLPTQKSESALDFDDIDKSVVEDVRLVVHTQPKLVKGLPKKKPEIFEIQIDGGTIDHKIKFAKEKFGKDLNISDFCEAGEVVDVVAVTRGRGFQGNIKRWGVKLLTHKNSKHRRMLGTLGPWHPNYVMSTVPQAGQVGCHQRTEYKKTIIKIGKDGKEITPNGGFLRYGDVVNSYLLIHGSVPGPTKRLIRLRLSIRWDGTKYEWEIGYVSTESKQGR